MLLTSDGVAKLADFGCSSLMDSTKTSTRSTVGTMVYMAPECMAGRASFPSDLWSLGLTALHLSTGEVPWSHLRDGNGLPMKDAQLMFHISKPYNAHPLPSDLPTWLSQTLHSCLCYDPLQRPTCQGLLQFFNDVSQKNGE